MKDFNESAYVNECPRQDWVQQQKMRWHFLVELILKNKYKIGAEIGTADGKNAFPLLSNTNIKLFCVDPYIKYNEYTNDTKANQDILCKLKEKAYCILQPYFDNKRCIHIEDTSKNACRQIEDESLDFVFIDANHDYKFVKEDIKIWKPKVKKGGLISGHDYCSDFPGTIKAVNEIFPDVSKGLDNTWYTYK